MALNTLEKRSPAESALLTRLEEKFVIPARLSPALLELIALRLKPSYPDETTRFNLIESVYFDTVSLDLFQDHFRSLEERFKLRSRRYAPNGAWTEDQAMIELKAKSGKVTRKSRVAISLDDLREFSLGSAIADSVDLRRRNRELGKKTVTRRLEQINAIVSEMALEPVCSVTYRRQAFEAEHIRVTLDERIQSTLVREIPAATRGQILESPHYASARAMRARLDPGADLLLEIKHDGTDHSWLVEFLLQNGGKQVRYSKYCSAIAAALKGLNE